MNKFPYTILWDLDGVIVDSAEAHFLAWSQTLSEIHVPFTRENFSQVFGMDNSTTISFLFGTQFSLEESIAIFDRKERLFLDSVQGNIHLQPCVRQWLEEFQNAGFLQLIASSAPQKNIKVVVDYLGIRPFFVQLVSAEGMPGKPNPAVFQKAAKLGNTSPDHCLIIEDSHPGIIAARKANMRCIAVATTHARTDLSDADLVVENCCSLTWDLISSFLETNRYSY